MEKIKFNKKADTSILEQVIFFTLNIAVFVILIAFVIRSASGALVYEQAYSKQIALLLDQAKPGTTIVFDMRNGADIAKKAGKNIDQIVIIDKTTREVSVALTNKGGYKYKYYSNLELSTKIDGGYLTIIAK